MSEKMLICDALDERDFLAKKINDAIKKFHPVATKRKMDKKLITGETQEEFEERIKREYQSIRDMIERKDAINNAIIMSNATTKIKLKSSEKEITVAEAIAIRKSYTNDVDPTNELIYRINTDYGVALSSFQNLAKKKDQMDESYKNTLAGRDNKILSEEEIASVEKLTEGYIAELIDPLNVKKTLEIIEEKHTIIKKEIDTAIKVSNATTYIEF